MFLLYYQFPLIDADWQQRIRPALAASDEVVMLESCCSASQQHTDDNRFSIYALQPLHLIECIDGQVACNTMDLPVSLSDHPFEALQYLLKQFPRQPASELPFEGGLMGYLGYDLGRSLERLPEIAEDDIHVPDMMMGFYTVAMVIDHVEQTLNIVGLEGYQLQADDLKERIENSSPVPSVPFKLQNHWQSNMTPEQYQQKFDRVQHYIRSGDCYQVNLAQRWQASFKGDSWQAYNRLFEENSAPFSGYIRFRDKAVLSVSPERFIRCKNGRCQTKPIKGTRPRASNQQQDEQQKLALGNSAKDRAENVMIVDLLRNDLSKVCQPHSVHVSSLFQIESFPAVHHLVSTIEAQLEPGKHPLDLLKAAFPGGSITGTPKIRAMEIIEELEPHRRSVYCGSLVYIGCNAGMDSNIAIRTLICDQDQIYCWAGGGLVADSSVDEEYEETLHKLNKILPVLQPE